MIHWLWLIPAAMFGGTVGLFTAALLRTSNSVAYYRAMYEQERREKNELKKEYNNRLDELGSAMDISADYVAFGMPELKRTEQCGNVGEPFDCVYE